MSEPIVSLNKKKAKTQKVKPKEKTKPNIAPNITQKNKKNNLLVETDSYSDSNVTPTDITAPTTTSAADALSEIDEQNANSDENKILLENEKKEREDILKIDNQDPDAFSYLYPSLNDTHFNIKITTKKEFNDSKYEGIKTKKNADGNDVVMDVEEYSKILEISPFELQPHQAFVKNFLSFETPYNSLLLYHGLGSG